MKRVLVTGAQGLLGGVLVKRLAEEHFHVVATGRGPASNETPGIVYQRCDLADSDLFANLFDSGIDAVVHAAARLRGDSDSVAPFVRDNVLATARLADAARRARVQSFILFSTISVYSGDGPYSETSDSRPVDAYGWSKRAAEDLALLNLGEAAVVLRLGGLHGAPRRGGIVREIIDRSRRQARIDLSEPSTRVTLTFIDDVIAAVARLLSVPTRPSRIYNLATAETITLQELAERIRTITGGGSPIVSAIAPRARNRVLDISRIRDEIGFAPLPLDVHLARLAMAYA